MTEEVDNKVYQVAKKVNDFIEMKNRGKTWFTISYKKYIYNKILESKFYDDFSPNSLYYKDQCLLVLPNMESEYAEFSYKTPKNMFLIDRELSKYGFPMTQARLSSIVNTDNTIDILILFDTNLGKCLLTANNDLCDIYKKIKNNENKNENENVFNKIEELEKELKLLKHQLKPKSALESIHQSIKDNGVRYDFSEWKSKYSKNY